MLGSEQTYAPQIEQLPEPVESEMCITQELDALKQTGSWVSKETQTEKMELSFDFPVVKNKQVSMYLDLFQNKQRKYFKLWLSRSSKYLPYIREELRKAGLPLDLAYLAMIESGFNQRAQSRANAVGLWQFMVGTGQDYNLRIDKYVDERRNMEKSTRAAIAYLSDLYEQFGDWHLAVAAYNGGQGKISNGIKKFKTNNFWQLAENNYLHLETKRYVPKLIAAMIIAKNPERYGFTGIDYLPPLEYETLKVGAGVSVDALALISGTSPKDILLLNQELKTKMTPLNQRNYVVNIPKGTSDLARTNFSQLRSVAKTNYATHIIRKGETLTAICERYNVNKTTILKANNLRSATLRAGQRLRIPQNTIDHLLVAKEDRAVAHSANGLILHKIRPGETISTIARKYGVAVETIVTWNGLKSVHKIRAGQQLSLYVGDDSTVTVAAAATDAHNQKSQKKVAATTPNNKVVSARAKKKKPIPSKDEFAYNWYLVKTGDTLWNISQRFRTSPKEIKLWNNLKSNLIHPGSKLKMKDV